MDEVKQSPVPYQPLTESVMKLNREQVAERLSYIFYDVFSTREVGCNYCDEELKLTEALKTNPEAGSGAADYSWTILAENPDLKPAAEEYALLYTRLNSLDAQERPSTQHDATEEPSSEEQSTDRSNIVVSKVDKIKAVLSKRPSNKAIVLGVLAVLAVVSGLGLGYYFGAHNWIYNQGANLVGRIRNVAA